jgi:hypothetical protein
MILSKNDLKRLVESVLKEQDDELEDVLLDDEASNQSADQEEQVQEDFKVIKFYLPRALINKLIDNQDAVAEGEEEIEIILKPDAGKLVYTVDGEVPLDLKPVKVMTLVGLGAIYGVDESGEKEKIANQLKDVLVLDKTYANKTLGRMKEILFQKIKLGRFNFGPKYLKDALNL